MIRSIDSTFLVYHDTMSISIGRSLVAITNKPNGLQSTHTCWFPQVEEVEGREVIKVVSYVPQFIAFVKNDRRMYQAMCVARNEATARAYASLATATDGDNPDALPVVKKGSQEANRRAD